MKSTSDTKRNRLRNEQRLKRIERLWFHPDGGMYVYYTPTHYIPAHLDPENS